MRRFSFLATLMATLFSINALAAETYTPVPVKIANPVEVPELLEKSLAELRTAADKRDLAAVLSYVGDSFFWAGDHGGGYQASDTPQVNFTNALSLDPEIIKVEYQPELWRAFGALLEGVTASTLPEKPGVICLPGKGTPVDMADATKTADRFGTELWFGMVFAVGPPVVVRQSPQSSAKIVGKINNEAVILRQKLRTDPDLTWEPVQLANGVEGWVHRQIISTFIDAQICFAKANDKAWKIVGYNGGGD